MRHMLSAEPGARATRCGEPHCATSSLSWQPACQARRFHFYIMRLRSSSSSSSESVAASFSSLPPSACLENLLMRAKALLSSAGRAALGCSRDMMQQQIVLTSVCSELCVVHPQWAARCAPGATLGASCRQCWAENQATKPQIQPARAQAAAEMPLQVPA